MANERSGVTIPPELRPVIAAAAKNLATHLYGPEGPAWGTSFASIEELAVLISRQLGSELIQRAVRRQADQPAPVALQVCPTCAGPLDELPPEPRSLHTDTGLADWQEPARHCPRCRRDFFPPEQGPGHRPHRA